MTDAVVEDVKVQVEGLTVEESSSAPEEVDEELAHWQEATKEEYDVIILGTGMKECLLSGLLSVNGKKVLHLDRNTYYGAASASLDIQQLFKRFRGGDVPDGLDKKLGRLRDYLVDLVPKFIIADGQLVKTLLHTGTSHYMEFKDVQGSFVFRRGNVHKVPVTPRDALNTSLMSPMEKTRAVQFFKWVDDYDSTNPKTFSAGLMFKKTLDLNTMTVGEFLKYWNLEQDTCDFVAHAVALYQEESYVKNKASDLVQRMQLYKRSLLRFEGLGSPYMYPLYGLGELPQSFARLAAVYGGVYMLNRDIDEVVYGDDGKAKGVMAKGIMGKAPVLIGDPTYFPGKTHKVGKVVRVMAIINHPLKGTGDCGSCQIIFPQNQVNRKNDLYLFCINSEHKVAAPGTWIAFASTRVEGPSEGLSAEEVAKRELAACLGFLEPAIETFYDMYDMEEPITDGVAEQVFVSKSYDETSHFETAITDVLDIYKRITGEYPDLNKQRGE